MLPIEELGINVEKCSKLMDTDSRDIWSSIYDLDWAIHSSAQPEKVLKRIVRSLEKFLVKGEATIEVGALKAMILYYFGNITRGLSFEAKAKNTKRVRHQLDLDEIRYKHLMKSLDYLGKISRFRHRGINLDHIVSLLLTNRQFIPIDQWTGRRSAKPMKFGTLIRGFQKELQEVYRGYSGHNSEILVNLKKRRKKGERSELERMTQLELYQALQEWTTSRDDSIFELLSVLKLSFARRRAGRKSNISIMKNRIKSQIHEDLRKHKQKWKSRDVQM